MTDNNEHALDLKQQPPCAGEVRQFPTGQALFLAPPAFTHRQLGHGPWRQLY